MKPIYGDAFVISPNHFLVSVQRDVRTSLVIIREMAIRSSEPTDIIWKGKLYEIHKFYSYHSSNPLRNGWYWGLWPKCHLPINFVWYPAFNQSVVEITLERFETKLIHPTSDFKSSWISVSPSGIPPSNEKWLYEILTLSSYTFLTHNILRCIRVSAEIVVRIKSVSYG